MLGKGPPRPFQVRRVGQRYRHAPVIVVGHAETLVHEPGRRPHRGPGYRGAAARPASLARTWTASE
jgi:hypothetical protein